MPNPTDELVVGSRRSLAQRVTRLVRRSWARERRRGATLKGRLASLVVFILFALMATIGAINAHGQDLRAGRDKDLADLVSGQADTNKRLQAQLAALRQQVDQLTKAQAGDPAQAKQLQIAAEQAAATPVKGPGVRVTLTDAPAEVQPEGVDGDLLVVHQQDIQMVVNLFWQAGAEAMTIQGQRVMSTTGVKCVGNSVVLHGIPYAPPYRIEAIGDPQRLMAALNASGEVRIYKQYVAAYQLGWKQESLTEVAMPAWSGGDGLQYAKPPA